MGLTAKQFKTAVEAFARTISPHELGLAYHRPDPNGQPTCCFANALSAVKQFGGMVRCGWYFHHRESLKFGDYLIAVHHAVWHDPKDCMLVDVTPFHHDPLHHPITQSGDVLFLYDPCAEPVLKDNKVIPLPSRFFPATSHPDLISYVNFLQQEEYSSYDAAHGTDFKVRT